MRRLAAIMLIPLIFFACGAPPGYQPGLKGFSRDEQQKLIVTANKYLGTAYKYGGKNGDGFDCSGFVVRVFKEALGIKVSSSATHLYRNSYPLNSDKAQPGDLVFFWIKGGIGHVGIMVSSYRFVHASKSSGVIISDFSSSYYKDHFFGIRRLK